ncbi:kinesin-like protein KIF24 isoform X2 [Perognathus longimembris pacificus]|uniref:kinesin-like protein KIF24 isoform X2 n=1 Tax=Perognathus longimembris pacificus TaxID=214514 RepID=UPI002018E63B|nr:kinesin-like protein KIF24 isoform X2 [Perognathus longimembris pacificus]
MASWLYECLCEAELGQYYPHFTALGLQKIDELAKVTMKDYSKLGVHNMNDRKRLFQLIKIIKIMQEEDKADSSPEPPLQTSNLCIKPQELRPGPRRQLHFDSPDDNKDRTASNAMNSLLDFSADEQKSTYLEVPEHMLPHDSQYHSEIRALHDMASDSYVQIETNTAVFSSNHFSPILGNCDFPVIQRVSHVSGYNYGIPHSCIRQNTSENSWTEMEKIRVCVRKRPLGIREIRRGEINIITVEDKETLLVHEKKEAVDLTQYILQHVFYFDEVFGEACTNQDVYMKTTYPLIQHIFSGGNATCFAYGQTGAGKTYTMIGTQQNPGLYALAAKDIFTQLEVSQPRPLFVWISFYEIYCGQLYDLLNRRKRLFAREDSKHVVQIVGLQELQVDSVEFLLEVILKGSKERSTGATGVNADSSRSHAIIQIQIKDSAKRTFGRISFIDLAGSERAADARDSDKQTKMEGAEINQSLLALKECIRALDQEHTHTPFRQSKLTQVLKDSFIGNAKTCMIANISPSHVATEHTLNTLRYADRVKELKKGIKCCASGTSRNRSSENSSPKRIQSSPVVLPGDKCSPKKVKLGLQLSLPGAAGSTRGKAYPLVSHPPNVPFVSVPKGPGKRGGSRGSPPQEWVVKTSLAKGTTLSGHCAKKGAEESAPLFSEKNVTGHKTAPGWAGRGPGPGEGLAHGKLPTRCKKVQTVRPVQKQLVPRVDFCSSNNHHLAEQSQDGKTGMPARLNSEAWTNIPPHQKEREEHLRFYHQQFQQPPLLQQKLKYQPLERFLCPKRPSEGELQSEASSVSHPDSHDGAPAEDLDDSDFSEDSFSHISSQRTTKQKNIPQSENSFFLHQSGEQDPEKQAAERRQCLLFSSKMDGDEKDLTERWVYSRDLIRSHKRAAFNPSHSARKVCLDWSGEEDSSSSGPSPRDNLAEKPSCSQVDFIYHQKQGGAPIFDIGQDTFTSGAPGPAEGSSPSLEDGFSSLSHIAVPGSPDERDTVLTVQREVGEGSPSQPFQEDSKQPLGTCSEHASGLMTPLTVSLLETPADKGPSPLEQLIQDGAELTGGPAMGHVVSSGDRETALSLSSATGRLWLSSSPPDNKPGGDLPALSPSPIHQYPQDKLPNRDAELGEVCQGTEPALYTQEHVGNEQYDADAEETELGGPWGFLGKPFSNIHTGVSHPGPVLTPHTGSSGITRQPWVQKIKHRSEHSWQELGLSTDPIRLSCYNEDSAWLKSRPESRCLATLDSPLVLRCSAKTAGLLGQPTLKQAQQVVIRAHQEQMDEMAELGFKEETLMNQLASNDFEDFVTQLDEIMALKSKCIQSLRSQLQLYLTCHKPAAAAPERTAVS